MPAARPCFARVTAAALVVVAVATAAAQTTATPPAPAVRDAIRRIQQLCEQRRYQEAAHLAEQTVREHKDDVNAWEALAFVHLEPDWAFRHDARAESAAERALKLGGHRPEIVAMLASAKHHQAKYDEALPYIAELCDATPPKVSGAALADLLVQRADIRLRTEALSADARKLALADLERAIAASPASASARVVRADLSMQDERYADALADLEVAVAKSPGSKQVHHQMHQCLARLGKREEALRHFEVWKRINRRTDSTSPSNAPTPEERRQLLRELAELNPADVERRLELAQVELELGSPDAAIAVCDALLASTPNWAPAVYVRGEAQKVKRGEARPPPPPKPASDEDGGGA